MLGKLLKYEFKSTARIFLPLYTILLVVALINGMFTRSEMFNIKGLLMMVFAALIISLSVTTIIVLVQRFRKNLLGDEGYLMFTLPVKSSSILLSKYLIALLWTVLSVIVSIVAFFMVAIIPLSIDGVISMSEYLGYYIGFIQTILSKEYLPYVIYVLSVLFLSYSTFIFTVYLAISTGQLSIFNKHRNIAAFISFIGMNTVFSFARNSLMMMYLKMFGEEMSFNFQISVVNGVVSADTAGLMFAIAIEVILLAGLFFSTKFILDKKLNLE